MTGSDEEERTVSTRETADTSVSDAATPERTEGVPSVDRAAESFVALEERLSSTAVEGRYARVVGADRVTPSTVPADYPRSIETDAAVALELELPGGETTTAYFAWPEDGNAPLARLLAALEIPPDSFADLHGRRLLVTVDEGYVLPAVPPDRPRGSPAGAYGVAGGLACNLLAFAGLALVPGLVASTWFLLGFLAVNMLVLPVATYRDAWHVRTHTDRRPGPGFWALCSLFVGLNVIASAAYLYRRRQARPLEES